MSRIYPEGWLTLSRVIPRWLTEDLAVYIGRKVGTLRRWREPITNGSGVESFLDMLYRVSAGLHHYHRPGYYELKAHILAFFDAVEREGSERWDSGSAGAEISKETGDFIQAAFKNRPLEEQKRELEESIAIQQRHLVRLNSEITASRQEKKLTLLGVQPTDKPMRHTARR